MNPKIVRWHKEARREAFKEMKQCEKCQKPLEESRLFIHHKQYSLKGVRSIYDLSYRESSQRGIVEILCTRCHYLEGHFAETLEEFRSNRMLHSGICGICNQFASKGWQRAETFKVDFPVCKKCSKSQRDKKILVTLRTNQLNLFQHDHEIRKNRKSI